MFKILGITGLLTMSLFASSNVSEFFEISEKDGYILKDDKKFTGSFKKRNMILSSKDGKIDSLSIFHADKEIASFEIANNQFNGKAFVSHQRLGLQNLLYKDGCLQKIETKNYKENFVDCNFKEGITSEKEKYTLSSKYPYALELDVFSFNIISFVFIKTDLENGLVSKRGERKIYRNSKLKRVITSVPQAGLNYVVSFNDNKTVHSISKFFMDSESSLIASFKDENLTHIVLFEDDVSLVENYKDGKLISKNFDLFDKISGVLYKTENGIFPDVNFE